MKHQNYPFMNRSNDELITERKANLWMRNVERSEHPENPIWSFIILGLTMMAMYAVVHYADVIFNLPK